MIHRAVRQPTMGSEDDRGLARTTIASADLIVEAPPSRIRDRLVCVAERRMQAFARPTVALRGRSRSTFELSGYVGLASALGLTTAIATSRGLSIGVVWGSAAMAVATFLILAVVMKVVTGEETLTYYHHVIAVLAITAVALGVAGQPVLRYLDLIVLGVALFTACGRIGCLMVGCCHGGPASWGIRYGREHVMAGFPEHLVGVRLFPVQALESVLLFAIVAGSIFLVLAEAQAGDALTWYLIAYGVVRFCLEFTRGDVVRSWFLGFSEAQWTSLIVVCVVIVGDLTGMFTFHPAHAIVAISLAGAFLLVARMRLRDGSGRARLRHPQHVKEIAEALRRLARADVRSPRQASLTRFVPEIEVARTSLGIQLSVGSVSTPRGTQRHWTVSRATKALDRDGARVLATLIAQLQNVGEDWQLVGGRNGVFHMISMDR